MMCPNCIDGHCYPAIPHTGFPLMCPICNGTAILPDNITYDPVRGGQIRKLRHDLNMTLREYCITHLIDAVQQSLWERGYFTKEASHERVDGGRKG